MVGEKGWDNGSLFKMGNRMENPEEGIGPVK